MQRDVIEAERDLLLAAFEEAPIIMSLVEGPELRILRMNRASREVYSTTKRTAREIYPHVNPVRAAAELAFATGIPQTVREMPRFSPEGEPIGGAITRSFVPLRNHEGKVTHMLTIAFEVTEEVRARELQAETARRNEAELKRLYALLEEAPVMISVLEGPDLLIVMSNRRRREVTGGRDFVGKKLADLVHVDSRTVAAARRVLATGVPESYESVYSPRDEKDAFTGRAFSIAVVPIPDPDGRITRVMCASIDITEQRRAREVLEDQARDAVASARAKDEFLAMLGHELRNPLASLVTTLEAMRLRGAGSRDEIEVLERQVKHLTRLVDDLLDVSRIARGLVELSREDIALPNVIVRALELARPLLEERRQRIVSDLESVTVHGDVDRLAQVVANVITNASKFSDPGAAIHIQTQRFGPTARITIIDEGIGISADLIGKIFDAFVQHPQKLARTHGGLGLGLSIVKSFVEAHGGTVAAQSDGLGKGSMFTIDLPAIDRAPAPVPVLPRVRPAASGRRILIVDDKRDFARALEAALQMLGHTVAVAHDGRSALAIATTFKPEIGLLDIGLPEMDGYELARALHDAQVIRLVAITGYGEEHDRVRALDAGFARHLVKPVSIETLQALLEDI
jgi:PAS domain S-box-containing protein